MATARIAYVDQPYAGKRVTPDSSRLSALYERGGAQLADIALQRGQNSARLFDRLGALFSGYHELEQQKKLAAATVALRREEREADRGEKQKDRDERAAERKEAARLAKESEDRGAARYMVDHTAAGPMSKVAAELALRFPETATRFSPQVTLPARPLPGAAGDMSAVPQETGQVVLHQSPDDARADEQLATQRARWAADDAGRAKDDDRAERSLKATIENQEAMRRIAQQNANTSARNAGGAELPGDWTKTGKEFLETLPATWRKTVEKIAQYDEDPVKAVGMRGGNREMLMRWVNQVNPAYDASQFSLRAPTRKAYTIGTQGQQINAINTAMGHLDQLATVADQLQQGGFVPGNKAWNAVRTAFGSDKVTNFDTLKDALAGEVAGVLSKSGATVSGIQDAKTHISAANSPTQLAGYVKTLIPVLGSKLASFDYAYKQAMGADDAFSPLSDEAKRILVKHGFDPAHPTVSPATPEGGAFIEAVDPDGNIHHAPAGTALPNGWKLKGR